MRGTVALTALLFVIIRFIPAHAGNSTARWADHWSPTVHPRACGEQAIPPGRKALSAGSSPRMRGTVSELSFEDLRTRFIPAHAGNSPMCHRRRWCSSVHPRACGEQRSSRSCFSSAPGSSPRMRGTGPAAPPGCRGRRFIPAHAGNRRCGVPSRTSRSVHPRACGEQHRVFLGVGCFVGSSPRMRGTAPAAGL